MPVPVTGPPTITAVAKGLKKFGPPTTSVPPVAFTTVPLLTIRTPSTCTPEVPTVSFWISPPAAFSTTVSLLNAVQLGSLSVGSGARVIVPRFWTSAPDWRVIAWPWTVRVTPDSITSWRLVSDHPPVCRMLAARVINGVGVPVPDMKH